METKMTVRDELLIAGVTFISTMITGSFWIDLLVGIVVYTSSRLFYHYFHKRIIRFIDKAKSWIKRMKAKLKRK